MAKIKSIKFCISGEKAVGISDFHFELTAKDSYLFDTSDYDLPDMAKRDVRTLIEAIENLMGESVGYELIVDENLRLNQFSWKLQDRSPEFPTKENSENHEQIVK